MTPKRMIPKPDFPRPLRAYTPPAKGWDWSDWDWSVTNPPKRHPLFCCLFHRKYRIAGRNPYHRDTEVYCPKCREWRDIFPPRGWAADDFSGSRGEPSKERSPLFCRLFHRIHREVREAAYGPGPYQVRCNKCRQWREGRKYSRPWIDRNFWWFCPSSVSWRV